MNNKLYGCFALEPVRKSALRIDVPDSPSRIFGFSYTLLSLVLFVLVSVSLQAQTSQLIPISGSVSVADGTYNLTFRLFDAASGGNYLGYTDVQNNFAVAGGFVSTVLGSGSGGAVPVAPFTNSSVYVTIESPPGTEIGSRIPIYSSGFAHIAQTLMPGAFISGSSPNPILTINNTLQTGIYASGYIGVNGLSAGQAGRGVTGDALGQDGMGVLGRSIGPGGRGVFGSATGPNGIGVRGEGDTGVWGENTGSGRGMFGKSQSGVGVGGLSVMERGIDSVTSIGVYGEGTYGVSGLGRSVGVYGSGEFSGVAAYGIARADLIWGLHQRIGTTAIERVFRVDNNGRVFANGGYQTGGADVAEFITVLDSPQPGDVVEIDPDHPRQFRLAATPNSPGVAGVISTAPGLTMNDPDAAGDADRKGPRLALIGRVPVKVSAENGAIRPGDLLVASATPGHAMRAPEPAAQGTVIGKALEWLEQGTGMIEMLVMLH